MKAVKTIIERFYVVECIAICAASLNATADKSWKFMVIFYRELANQYQSALAYKKYGYLLKLMLMMFIVYSFIKPILK